MADIVVVGSANIDLNVRLERIPGVGETLLADSLAVHEGGKGANQAVSASRLGGKTAFVGCVGDDDNGKRLVDKLQGEGIDCRNIIDCENTPSGTAMIFIDRQGQNSIAVVQGSNLKVCQAEIDKAKPTIENSKVVLLQHEIPLETNEYVAKIASDNGVEVVLNPAPAKKISEGIYKYVSVVIPNEYEAQLMTGIEGDDDESIKKQVEYFHSKGVEHVIITLGAKGAFVSSNGKQEIVASPKVEAVDTVAAGDCFCGAFAVARSNGKDVFESVAFAAKAASVSVTRVGAMDSIPKIEEVVL